MGLKSRMAILVALAAFLGALVISAPAMATAPSLYAFGDNERGELGNESNLGIYGAANFDPALVDLPGAVGTTAAAAAGGYFSLVTTSSGQLFAMGDDEEGQLGHKATDLSGEPTPAVVGLPEGAGTVSEASAGFSFSLALTSSGHLYSFGSNRHGQLGYATTSDEPSPTPAAVTLPGATGSPTRISAGNDSSLALTSSGQLYGFGWDEYGQLGGIYGEFVDTPTLVELPVGATEIVQISEGGTFSLVLTTSGQVYAFGENRFGQLGSTTHNGTLTPSPTPTLVSFPGEEGHIVEVAAGFYSSLALTSTGQLYAFGENRYGQLGVAANSGTASANPTPALVSLPEGAAQITHIAAGLESSFALTSTHQLYAFGSNVNGQLGIATNSETETANATPTLVATGVESVSSGSSSRHTLIVKAAESTGAKPSFTIETRQKLEGESAYTNLELEGATGQTVDYQVSVTNTGNVPLELGKLKDAHCTSIAPSGTAVIDEGKTDTYTCSHLLSEVGQYTDEASIEGSQGTGRESSNELTTEVSAPASFTIEALQKLEGGAGYTSTELTAKAGQTVEYETVVENTDSISLKFSALTDPDCASIVPSGEVTVAAGGSQIYTCTHVLAAGGSYAAEASIEAPPGRVRKTSNRLVINVPTECLCTRIAEVTPTGKTVARPTLTAVALTHERFRVAKAATALSAAKTPLGTDLHFTLSAAAEVRVKITHSAAGLRHGHSCLAPTAGLRRAHAKACKRTVTVGTLTRANEALGADTLAFSGRLGHTPLKAGSYEMTLTATDSAGSSAPAALAFTVVR